MAFDYVMTARRLSNGKFQAEPGPVKFIKVPQDKTEYDESHVITRAAWVNEVIGLADGDENPLSISPTGDILVYVHGFNNTIANILDRQRNLATNLRAEKWRGVIVSFDWPSNNQILGYLEDRSDGAQVAQYLVENCLSIVVAQQNRGCLTNIHLVGHSAGAFVITKALEFSPNKGSDYKSDWRLGQVAFISADVSRNSFFDGDQWIQVMNKRVMRLTNYFNPYDAALAVSNAKRLGVAPRAGRRGLPDDVTDKLVDVNCGPHFLSLKPPKDPSPAWSHSWYFQDRVFARDLAMTLEGAIDRNYIPTRKLTDGKLVLLDGDRPANMAAWGIDDAAKLDARTA
jgi:pimeloyl-ACP methyl ester carboxylesterase